MAVPKHQITSFSNSSGESLLAITQTGTPADQTFRIKNPKLTGSFFVSSKGDVWACEYARNAIWASRLIDVKTDEGSTLAYLDVKTQMEPVPADCFPEIFESSTLRVSAEIHSCQPDIRCQVLSYRYDDNGGTVVRVRLTGIDDVHTFTLSRENTIV